MSLENTPFSAKRILIIGCSGAGKTTLALELGRITGLPVIHLDRLYWRPGWMPTPDEEWRETVSQLIQQDEWIMDGNFGGTLADRIKRADVVVFFDFPTHVCVRRILTRWIRYRGRTRPDLHPGCPEKIDIPFLIWIMRFRRRSKPRILKTLSNTPSAQIIILRSHSDVNELRLH